VRGGEFASLGWERKMLIHFEKKRGIVSKIVKHLKKEREFFGTGDKWKAGWYRQVSINGKDLIEVKVEGPLSRKKLIDALQ
jgi:hypothetical protein